MTPRGAKQHDPRQEELALSTLGSINVGSIFVGRVSIRISEVAKLLSCDEKHVVNLIEEFELTGGTSGMKGFSIGRQFIPRAAGEGDTSLRARFRAVPRSCWRVATSDLDAFLDKRRTSHT